MSKLYVQNNAASAVANAVWACAPDSEVADIVFPKANYLVKNPVRLDAQSLMLWYKGDLSHVLSIANNVKTPTSVLESFAKDTRLSVKRALLANPSTPAKPYAKLASWALGINDEEGLRSMSRVMDIHALCQSFLEYKRLNGENSSSRLRIDHEALAERLVHYPSLVLSMASMGCLDLNKVLACYINAGKIPSISLLDLVKIHPAQEDTANLVQAVLEAKVLLNTDLTTSWLHAAAVSDYYSKRAIEDNNLFDLVQDGCQKDLLVRGNPAMISTAIVNGVSEEDLLQAINGFDYEMHAVVNSLSLRSVSAACEEHLADRVIDVLSNPPKNAPEILASGVITLLLTNMRYALPDSKILALLNNGSLSTIQSWLRKPADSPNKVRVGVVKSILEDLSTGKSVYRDHMRPVTKDVAYLMLQEHLLLAAGHTPGLVDVLIEHYDEYLGKSLQDKIVMRAVYPVLLKNFGASSSENLYMREHWESFLTFACDWEHTFSGLLATVVELHRRPGQESPDPDAETQLAIKW